MMKCWKMIMVSMLLPAFLSCTTAFASGRVSETQRVYDQADLFDHGEEKELETRISELQESMDMGLAIVTTEKNSGSARDFADDFYERYDIGFGDSHDGALFLIDMEQGELWISTEGVMIRYLTDERIDAILDDSIEYAYGGDFYASAYAFLDGVQQYYEAGIQSDQYNYDTETGRIDRYRSIQWYEFFIALAVASVVGGIAVLAVVREYEMKDDSARMSANFRLSYRKDSSFALGNVLTDLLLNSYVTRTVIRTQSSPRLGGGSGRSGGGRSSTHRSGSGRVHGGGGRKFR